MTRIGIVGTGKMGLSHLALFNAHPRCEVVAICDPSQYVTGVLTKYTNIPSYGRFDSMVNGVDLDAIVVATPTSTHIEIVERALRLGLHVFCEKPLTLGSADSDRLATLALDRNVVTKVGYHNRYAATFREVKHLLDAGAIGDPKHILGEAYGPVVLGTQGRTWRASRHAGGGCLYDYAAHVINLCNWYFGEPIAVSGTALPKIFSRETDDAVFSTLCFTAERTGQISAYWSDESFRKMATRITIWGTEGSIYADRQECRAYLRGSAPLLPGYSHGWNVGYATDLADPPWFFLRGEEYSEQVDAFIEQIHARTLGAVNDFESAACTDRTIEMIIADAAAGPFKAEVLDTATDRPDRRSRWWRLQRKGT